MIDEILISIRPGETRAALMAEGRVVELISDRHDQASLVGDVYLGRVRRVVPSIDAAFVDIGAARNGYLGLDDALPRDEGEPDAINDCVHEGMAVLVQVSKDAVGDKGPRLTQYIGMAGRYLVLTPEQDGFFISRRIADAAERERLEALAADIAAQTDARGYVVRTQAEGTQAPALKADAEDLRDQWDDLQGVATTAEPPQRLYREAGAVERVLRDHAGAGLIRVCLDDPDAYAAARKFCAQHLPELSAQVVLHEEDTPLFEAHGIEAEIERCLGREVFLHSGASLVIDDVEAFTAIDVNTGRNVARANRDDTILATNLEAAVEIARQIRLRNLAGLIVVDFVHMDWDEDRDAVVAALRAAVRGDPMAVEVGGVTPMGLVEMTRKRRRPPIAAALLEECAHCGGQGKVPAVAMVALAALEAALRAGRRAPGADLRLAAAPAVTAVLEGELAAARDEVERDLARKLVLSPDAEMRRGDFDIVVGEGGALDEGEDNGAE